MYTQSIYSPHQKKYRGSLFFYILFGWKKPTFIEEKKIPTKWRNPKKTPIKQNNRGSKSTSSEQERKFTRSTVKPQTN